MHPGTTGEDKDVIVVEVFVGGLVVDVGFDCEAGGGGHGGGGGRDGGFEGFGTCISRRVGQRESR